MHDYGNNYIFINIKKFKYDLIYTTYIIQSTKNNLMTGSICINQKITKVSRDNKRNS